MLIKKGRKNNMIFATDIDGTLLQDDKTIHPKTLFSIKEARKLGHYFVVASGRSKAKMGEIIDLTNNEIDFLICNNGAFIFDLKNNKDIFLKEINPKYFEECFNFAKLNNISFTIHTNKNIYTWPIIRYKESLLLDEKIAQNIINFNKNNPDKNCIYTGEYITQLSFFASNEFVTKNYLKIKNDHKNINEVYLTNGVFIDINPINISKWSGLTKIAKTTKTSLKNIITFGDSGNDYEMLNEAKENGFALANATKDLLDLNIVPKIGNNNSDAIGKIILEKIK
ncbi:MAG: Cof-type HAD-IIB family hydrolase [Metamycoplasmataceae bacterium]